MDICTGRRLCNRLAPELHELWDKEVAPKMQEKGCDYTELSVAFCEQARLRGYVVVYDPQLGEA